ncbi:DNA polymerase/3'-5' exonuclease PolX [Rubrobacter xylanophilus DSM 9941]|uniref:DNA polymerase/3'-5' exonuclease PolX n=1 Tax=Rubrobacter xylanophilus TaxID=49319 RepID=UPI001C63FDBA|nr:DNA polymerase/3'-5' exonuclease PolX [Rubrobacter xylanophilus]QYJ16713.1 DNA polymerase/3'-5' exonuclease PolX [Rubrobacter xylanophilus DSM 9941]
MPIHNAEIAAILHEVADLLEIEGENPFRVRAYREAARTVENHPRSLAEMAGEGEDLTRLPGIGEDLAGKIREIVRTGTLRQTEELRERVPPGLRSLLGVPGLGPRRVRELHRRLGITSAAELERAAREGKVRRLPGFGEKTERNILEALSRGEAPRRLRLASAEPAARALEKHLRGCTAVREVVVAGSFRRRKETVGDLDVVACSQDGRRVVEHFVAFGGVERVVSRGGTRSSVVLKDGLEVDLRVVPEESFGAALLYFTGAQPHHVALRDMALQKKLKLNEYGLFRGEERVAGRTEAEVYGALGLRYIEPELREHRGEIEAASEDALPELLTREDIRGDLHSHTTATDGRNSLEEMARAAEERGYEYLAITDHSRRLRVARGLDERRLREQMEQIDRLNEELEGITLLKGAEVDILEDGSLDLPDGVLRELDVVICSVHHKLRLPEREQTRRVLRALDNPHVNILAHPTGRLIGRREPCELDVERVMEVARERGCILELNANPERLDLNDAHCRLAKEMGVRIAVSTDAHGTNDLANIRFGVGQARRGWLEREDVVNTRPLGELRTLLRREGA